MSGVATGLVRLPLPRNVGDGEALPLDPADGGVQCHLVGAAPSFTISLMPNETIYETAGAAEIFSVIPASALPASVSSVVARLLSTAAAPRWIQIHKGQLLPALGAKPYLVGDIITPIGGNTQWAPPGGAERDPALSNGYVVVLSTTEDTFTNVGLAELTTTAMGRV